MYYLMRGRQLQFYIYEWKRVCTIVHQYNTSVIGSDNFRRKSTCDLLVLRSICFFCTACREMIDSLTEQSTLEHPRGRDI